MLCGTSSQCGLQCHRSCRPLCRRGRVKSCPGDGLECEPEGKWPANCPPCSVESAEKKTHKKSTIKTQNKTKQPNQSINQCIAGRLSYNTNKPINQSINRWWKYYSSQSIRQSIDAELTLMDCIMLLMASRKCSWVRMAPFGGPVVPLVKINDTIESVGARRSGRGFNFPISYENCFCPQPNGQVTQERRPMVKSPQERHENVFFSFPNQPEFFFYLHFQQGEDFNAQIFQLRDPVPTELLHGDDGVQLGGVVVAVQQCGHLFVASADHNFDVN